MIVRIARAKVGHRQAPLNNQAHASGLDCFWAALNTDHARVNSLRRRFVCPKQRATPGVIICHDLAEETSEASVVLKDY
jgi:hypothetical protein